MKVFIGMPVYNGERFIKDALDSLLTQTFTDWKLFISDDCSTDSTEAICQQYAEKDKRIIYYRQPKNIGIFENFKYTLDKCDLEYFMWAAQDDLWEKDFIKVCLDHFEKKPHTGLVTTCTEAIDSFSRSLSRATWMTSLSGNTGYLQVARYILQPEILGKCNLMYSIFKTEALRTTWNAYPQRHIWGQDYMFSLAAISRFNVIIDERTLFKKRLGGYSSPQLMLDTKGKEVVAMNFKNPKNHIFPFRRFKGYFMGHMEALRGTPYRPLAAVILLIRLPRAFLIYVKERNIKNYLRKLILK